MFYTHEPRAWLRHWRRFRTWLRFRSHQVRMFVKYRRVEIDSNQPVGYDGPKGWWHHDPPGWRLGTEARKR